MPRRTPRSTACGVSASMPSSTCRRAAARSPSGAGPQTSTSTSAPSSAASSTAARLSAPRSRRLAVSGAGKKPPRQRLDTLRPASRISSAAPGTELVAPGREPADPGLGTGLNGLGEIEVVGGDLVEGKAPGVDAHGWTPATASSCRIRCDRQRGIGEQPGAVGEPEELAQVGQRACALESADHAESVLVAVEPGQEDDAGLVVPRGRRRTKCGPAAGWGRARRRSAPRRRRPGPQGRPPRRARSRRTRRAGRGCRRRDQPRVVVVVAGIEAHAGGQLRRAGGARARRRAARS